METLGFMGRLHDKYLIVDDVGYILGGRNTFDYFLGDQPGYKNYDWDVFVYTQESKGDRTSLNQVEEYFTSVWERPECKVMGKKFFLENQSFGENCKKGVGNPVSKGGERTQLLAGNGGL